MVKHQKFYVVWKGRDTGVFSSWEECSAQVIGFPEAKYQAYSSRYKAEEAFKEKYSKNKKKIATQNELLPIGKPITNSFSVDAACRGNPGVMEFRCVHNQTRQQIFREGPFREGTNNIGEFLAIVQALVLFREKGILRPIYSDSRNAIAWVMKKECNTMLKRNNKNAELFKIIEIAETWLKENALQNQVLKWHTKAWGEIPADFGHK